MRYIADLQQTVKEPSTLLTQYA